jgi:hypothetical protein
VRAGRALLTEDIPIVAGPVRRVGAAVPLAATDDAAPDVGLFRGLCLVCDCGAVGTIAAIAKAGFGDEAADGVVACGGRVTGAAWCAVAPTGRDDAITFPVFR